MITGQWLLKNDCQIMITGKYLAANCCRKITARKLLPENFCYAHICFNFIVYMSRCRIPALSHSQEELGWNHRLFRKGKPKRNHPVKIFFIALVLLASIALFMALLKTAHSKKPNRKKGRVRRKSFIYGGDRDT